MSWLAITAMCAALGCEDARPQTNDATRSSADKQRQGAGEGASGSAPREMQDTADGVIDRRRDAGARDAAAGTDPDGARGVDVSTADASVDAATDADASTNVGDGSNAPDGGPAEAGTAGGDATDAGTHAPDAASADASASDGGDPDAAPDDAGPDAPTFLNAGDAHPGVYVAPDRISAEWRTIGTAGVRSTRAIAPGEGVFYYEATTHEAFDAFTIGVATAAQPLDQNAGATDQSFGVDPSGEIYAGGAWAGGFGTDGRSFGFVLDYRAQTAIVHVIASAAGRPVIVRSETLSAIADPLFIYLAGIRRTTEMHVTINTGHDTVNAPFAFDPRALLRGAGLGDAADALLLGWGSTHAGVWNAPPVVAGPTPTGVSVPAGTPVTLTASASDVEDGALDAALLWEVLSTGYGPERVQGTGPSFTFTPAVLGIHPVRVTIVDSGGKRARAQVDVHASGVLPQYEDVRLSVEPQSGAGVVVSDDGVRVRWTAHDKQAIRANQGLYDGFWYFEVRPLVPPASQAGGVVIGGAALNPYPFNVTPPSCSISTVAGVYQNLIYRAPPPDPAVEYYGFAVDYRGRYPIVHILLADAVAHTLHLHDATVPIYPMLYGHPTYAGAEWDLAINFGAEPFKYDPAAALTAAGIDASELLVCWGAANAACP